MGDLVDLIDLHDVGALREMFAELGVAEVADELVRLDPIRQAVLFRLLPKDDAVEVFEQLEPSEQTALIDALRADEVTAVIEELDPDDRVRLLEEVPAVVAARLLAQLSPAEQQHTALLLGYSEGSAGRVMSPEYVSIPVSMSAAQAIERVRTAGVNAETIYVLYVKDVTRRLIGVVSLKDIVLADPGAKIDDLMTTEIITGHTSDDAEVVARRLADNDLLAIPILDSEDRLVGIVTVDDALAVIERAGTEDVERIGGATPLDRPYLGAGVVRVYRARVAWLAMLLVVGGFTGTVMRSFEASLSEVVALAFFIPLLIGTGGNAGSQTSTTVVRAMAIGEVRIRDLGRVVAKEARVGLLLGLTVAALGALRALTWGEGAEFAYVVALGLVSVVMVGTTVGSMLPMVLKRLGRDPAVVSAPFISTFVDTIGLLLYFTFAKLILGV